MHSFFILHSNQSLVILSRTCKFRTPRRVAGSVPGVRRAQLRMLPSLLLRASWIRWRWWWKWMRPGSGPQRRGGSRGKSKPSSRTSSSLFVARNDAKDKKIKRREGRKERKEGQGWMERLSPKRGPTSLLKKAQTYNDRMHEWKHSSIRPLSTSDHPSIRPSIEASINHIHREEERKKRPGHTSTYLRTCLPSPFNSPVCWALPIHHIHSPHPSIHSSTHPSIRCTADEREEGSQSHTPIHTLSTGVDERTQGKTKKGTEASKHNRKDKEWQRSID